LICTFVYHSMKKLQGFHTFIMQWRGAGGGVNLCLIKINNFFAHQLKVKFQRAHQSQVSNWVLITSIKFLGLKKRSDFFFSPFFLLGLHNNVTQVPFIPWCFFSSFLFFKLYSKMSSQLYIPTTNCNWKIE